MNPLGADPRLQAELSELVESLRRVTVRVRNGSASNGSGVVWSEDGLVVTNAHVVPAPRVTVELDGGRVLPARVVRRDPGRDLCALRVNATGLPAAVPGDARAARPGDLVVALGHPFGLGPALSVGVLHAAPSETGAAGRWIRADLRLAPGNSGGPLADVRGRVLGLNAMIVRGLAFAVPSAAVARFLRGGAPAVLGVTARPVRLPRGAPGLGFLVLEVMPGSAAAAAGLAAGDVLTGASGRRFRSPGELGALIRESEPGARLALELVRGFERLAREVVLQGGPEVGRAA